MRKVFGLLILIVTMTIAFTSEAISSEGIERAIVVSREQAKVFDGVFNVTGLAVNNTSDEGVELNNIATGFAYTNLVLVDSQGEVYLPVEVGLLELRANNYNFRNSGTVANSFVELREAPDIKA